MPNNKLRQYAPYGRRTSNRALRARLAARCLKRYVSMNLALPTMVSLLLSSTAMALDISCGPADSSFQRHSHTLETEYLQDQDTWAVIFRFPKEISDLEFEVIQIYDPSRGLAIPLRAVSQHPGIMESHFYGSEDFIQGLKVLVSYGFPCSQSFRMELKHNKSSQSDASEAGAPA